MSDIIGKPCCFCGYNGYDEEECLLDPESTDTHCECWWDSGEIEEQL